MGKRFEPVLLVDKDDFRIPLFGLFLIHRYECCDDDLVPRLYFAGSRSVERDSSASRVSRECVGGEPLAGCNTPDIDLLEGENASSLHQGRVYLDASLVVEIGARHSCPVNLALEHSQLQSCSFPAFFLLRPLLLARFEPGLLSL